MEENLDEHLSPAELARILAGSRDPSEQEVGRSAGYSHLSTCAACRDQYDALTSLDRRLSGVRLLRAGASSSGADCPRPGVWREIAGGLTPADETLALIEHASRCDRCGPMLHEAVSEMADLKGEVTEEERRQIVFLESAGAEWQQRLAHQIATAARNAADRGPEKLGWRQKWVGAPRLAFLGVSLAVVVVAGYWFEGYRHQPAAADRLLARAYTEKRTLELRIAGADYAPPRVSLGPIASFTSRPPALLKAEALIASQLESHPSDPAWLQAKAQADILEGKYDAGVEALRRALELDPHSAPLLIDLGTAYFQRALQEDRKEDFGAAYESLSQALQLRPDDPVALFNRAIVAEREFLYQQAEDDWEHYLRVDGGSQWSQEARVRANAVREKLKQHESKLMPLLSPEQVATLHKNADGNLDGGSEVDDRIDEYLDQAIRSWLPRAFPGAKAKADLSASQALFFLAGLTAQKHGDRWLADFLSGSSAANFPQAALALARALQSNRAGQFDIAREQARLAEGLFRRSGNAAGAVRAEFEELFAIQVGGTGEECRPQAAAAQAEAEQNSYSWLRVQLELEKAVCSITKSDIGADEKASRHAMEQAQKSGYGALFLRAAVFAADDKLLIGDPSGATALADAGLERYWSGQYPPVRGYSLYAELTEIAGSSARSQANLQVALWREAVALADLDEEPVERGAAHKQLANAATAAGLSQLAEQHYAEASVLFAAAPQTGATREAVLEAEIRTARLEAQLGRFDDAIARLTRVQEQIAPRSSGLTAQMFYSTLGILQLGRNRETEAEQAFLPALRMAEQNLASLGSAAERVSWSEDAAPVYLGLAESELIQGREQDSLNTFEWYLGAPHRVAVRAATDSSRSRSALFLPDADRLTARLPLLSKQTVVAYGVLPDGLAIWVYDDRGIHATWIPKSARDLQELAAAFYSKCSDPHSEPAALVRDSEDLYSLLIAPIEQRLDPRRTLVIETEGFLARLPFEALVDGNGRYLIERVPIVHSPGAYAEGHMRAEDAISVDSPAFVVGSDVSSPDTGLFAVPDVPGGTQAVASGFHSAHVLNGREATLAAVTKGMPQAAVFHFEGHAVDAFNHSGLLLQSGEPVSGGQSAEPTLLDADAVRRLPLQKLQLAVLAACNTDSGEGGSRGFDSVAQALQASGVPHVVASRWAVDSVQATAFVNGFYGSLLSGQPVSNATRLTAQRMLLNPRTTHPYYWAAFAAYGRP